MKTNLPQQIKAIDVKKGDSVQLYEGKSFLKVLTVKNSENFGRTFVKIRLDGGNIRISITRRSDELVNAIIKPIKIKKI